MKKNSLFLGETNDTDINLIISENDYRPAILSLNNKHFPKIIPQDDQIMKLLKESQNKYKDSIRFVYNNRRYSALNNQFDFSVIYAETIIEADINNIEDIQIQSVRYYLSNFNRYILDGNISNKFENSEFTRKISMPEFSTKINYKNLEVSIFNKYLFDTEKNDRKFKIDEYPVIEYRTNDKFEFYDIVSFSHDLSMIFTYLTGYECYPMHIWVSDDNSYYRSLYKPVPTIRDINIVTSHEFIFKFKDLCEKNDFSKIFTNYYSNERFIKFKKLYSRFYYLYSSQNEWEYELLGYLSVFEKSISNIQKYKYIDIEIKKNIIDTVKNSLLTEFKKNRNIDYEPIEKSVLNYKEKLTYQKKHFLTFREKYLVWIENLDQTLNSIFSFDEREFKIIKKLRDDIAHSNSIDYSDYDISKIFEIIEKMKLILLYLIYTDLGFDLKRIISNLHSTMNPILRKSNIDKVALKRASGRIPFIKINNHDFKYFAEHNLMYLVVEKKTENTDINYLINKSFTENVNNSWINDDGKQFHNIRDFLKDLYKPNNIEINFSSGYVETKDGLLKDVHGLCIIDI